MELNKTSWDAYSEDSFEEEFKQDESPLIIEAKKNLFLRRYDSCPLDVKNIYIIFIILNIYYNRKMN